MWRPAEARLPAPKASVYGRGRIKEDTLPGWEGKAVSYFKKELERRQGNPGGRHWLFVPYDHLTDRMGPLFREEPRSLGIVLVENPWKAWRFSQKAGSGGSQEGRGGFGKRGQGYYAAKFVAPSNPPA